MKVFELLEILKSYPKDAIVAPKTYSEGAEGITLEFYIVEEGRLRLRLGGVDIPFVVTVVRLNAC